MRNLAGVQDAGAYICAELDEATIARVVHEEPIEHSEVPTRVTGELGNFTFRRLWYYYSVRGQVPFAVAQELYADPIGRAYVRVGGHCGCPPPEGDVECYHIDSQSGLNLFVEVLRRHGLVTSNKVE